MKFSLPSKYEGLRRTRCICSIHHDLESYPQFQRAIPKYLRDRNDRRLTTDANVSIDISDHFRGLVFRLQVARHMMAIATTLCTGTCGVTRRFEAASRSAITPGTQRRDSAEYDHLRRLASSNRLVGVLSDVVPRVEPYLVS